MQGELSGGHRSIVRPPGQLVLGQAFQKSAGDRDLLLKLCKQLLGEQLPWFSLQLHHCG